MAEAAFEPLNSVAQYFTGLVFVYLKRALIVFTNYRILHIPTTADYDYKNSIAQVAYAGCHSIELKGGTLVVQYERAGLKKKEKFTAIAGTERRKIMPVSENYGHHPFRTFHQRIHSKGQKG